MNHIEGITSREATNSGVTLGRRASIAGGDGLPEVTKLLPGCRPTGNYSIRGTRARLSGLIRRSLAVLSYRLPYEPCLKQDSSSPADVARSAQRSFRQLCFPPCTDAPRRFRRGGKSCQSGRAMCPLRFDRLVPEGASACSLPILRHRWSG